MFGAKFFYNFTIFLCLLAAFGCSLQADLTSLEDLSEVPDCVVANNVITNSPCVIKDSEGLHLAAQKFSGRSAELTTAPIEPTTTITLADGAIDTIEVTSTMPQGWSNNQTRINLDTTLGQKGGAYNADYIAANIASGVNIFGLIGSYVVTQKPFCSTQNSTTPTSSVPGINTPPLVPDRQCMANAGSFIYATAFNGRIAECNLVGGTNNASCFVKQSTQDLFLTNATNVPLACTYNGAVNPLFYDGVWTSADFGKLRSPTISGVVRNFCQVSNSQFFYPSSFGGRGQVCGTIAAPPCWLNIPPSQTRTVSSSNSGTTPVCLEDQNDSLPSNWTGTYDQPLSKNTVQCLTAGNSRYVYTSAYDGRFRNCASDQLGQCFIASTEVANGFSYIFTTSDDTACRNNLNTCKNTCDADLAGCAGDQNTCFATLSACVNTCYSKTTAPIGYTRCMTNACQATKSACDTACGANTTCRNTCTANYNNCNYTENPRTNVYYLNPALKLVNPTTKALIIPTGQKRSVAIPASQLHNTNAIKAGIGIFGITGSFGGLGIWASGMHRNMSVPQLTLSEENNTYAGSSDTKLPVTAGSSFDPNLPYREVVSILLDDEGAANTTNAVATPNRADWGMTTCGVGATFNTLDKKIADCNAKFGSNSLWDGSVSGNAGQGRWTLVTRKANSLLQMVEVWRDERTQMLWSSLISEGTNWCKASGSSDNPGVNARYREADISGICNDPIYQAQAGPVISACLIDAGFSDIDASFTQAGKVDLTTASTPAVHWRIPTMYDYDVAEFNGIRFVMPDMGIQRTIPLNEWTGTVNSLNRAEAWAISSIDGAHRVINRSDAAGVRCIGR